MPIKNIASWKIPNTQPFFPLGIHCIGVDNDKAILTYAHHTVNTQIFRNFNDALTNDNEPHKTYLHTSLYPDCIKDVIVGNTESIILLNDGRIMYFTSPKKLMTVKYLSGVKTICCCQNGFALIKLSQNGSEFFIEIHPDAFQGQNAGVIGRKTYNITFDKIPELESTWHQTRFKIKELHFNNAKENFFLKSIFPDDILIDDDNGCDRFLFVSMDKTFCSLHLIGDDHLINPITQCNANILDFWPSNDGQQIFLLLDNGAMELFYLKVNSNEVTKQHFYFGAELSAFHFHENIFYFSTGLLIEYGCFKLNEKSEKFLFHRNSVELPGIVALTYLPDFQFLLGVSENRLFYRISTKPKQSTDAEWIEVNDQTQKKLRNVKYELNGLAEAYDNLLDRQRQHQQLLDIIKLKKTDKTTINSGDDSVKYRFMAKCIVNRMPPIQRHNDTFTNLINLENPLPYDRMKSFFVNITITAITYAKEFDNDLWYLRCRWLNDKCEDEYANIRLINGMLSKPLTFIIHLQEQHLPKFDLNLFTMNDMGKSAAIHIDFPVYVEQPDYCEMMDIDMANVKATEIRADDFSVIGTIYVPKIISLNDLISEKLVSDDANKKSTMKSNVFVVYLLGMELTGVYYDDKEMLRLMSNSAELMHAFKQYICQRIENKLIVLGQTMNMRVITDVLKAYRVSSINLIVFKASADDK